MLPQTKIKRKVQLSKSGTRTRGGNSQLRTDRNTPVNPVYRVARGVNLNFKSVNESYVCPENAYKFCLPCGQSSARQIEETLLYEKSQRKRSRSKSTPATAKKDKANAKALSSVMRVYAKQRYPNEARNEDKFVELAVKL